ncbi:MAG: hemerythrin domain-containing protein [bacterium]|nr:hemerythrin domain-containing protein [bacterium]
MKNPIKILQEEHKILLSAVTLGFEIQKVKDEEEYRHLVNDFILFIRNYSEIYHFPKEEDIFYPLLRDRSKSMDAEFMHEICDNHQDFKSFVAEIENHFANYDYDRLRTTMDKYLREMFDHMNRENRIILAAAGVLFTEQELNKLYDDFVDYDEHHGEKINLEKDFYKISHQILN